MTYDEAIVCGAGHILSRSRVRKILENLLRGAGKVPFSEDTF
jgi:hypothetical protein